MVNAKRLITPIISIGVGFFTFIFMIMDYLSISYGWISAGSNGYESIGDFFELADSSIDAGFLGIFIGIALIFILIAALAMIAMGVFGLLKETANINVLPDATLNSFSKLSLKLYFIISVSAAGLYLLLCLINGFDLVPGIGYWFLLVLAVGGFVANTILSNKFAAEISASAPASCKYKCSSCGASAKASERFCSKCGSPVIMVQPTAAAGFRCSSCASPANAGEKFCSKCGSPVVAAQPAAGFRCSSCGSPANAGEKFCSKCGSPVVAMNSGASAQRFCPTCGTAVNANDRFCATCGTVINP